MFKVINMSFNAIHENKIIAKISEFTVLTSELKATAIFAKPSKGVQFFLAQVSYYVHFT